MGVFEAALLPIQEKERLCRELLEEFGLPIKTFSSTRKEMIIPCVLGEHQRQDREPTGALNYEKLVFKCLGCGRSGGLLWLIASLRGTSSSEARSWLAKETGTDGQVMELGSLLRYFDALYGDSHARAPIPHYPTKALEPWNFIHPWVTDAPAFDADGNNVGGWGISEENVARFMVGYAEKYPYSKDIYSERIIIPHFWKGHLVGWQSRRICNDGTAKYKSSIDFPKDQTIYNYDPDHHDTAIVVESPKSVIRHDGDGLHFVATFGKNVTDTQRRLLGRYKRLIWWFDNDPAGWSAYEDQKDRRGKVTQMGVLSATSLMTHVWTVQNPYREDAGDLPTSVVSGLVDAAVPWILFEIPRTLLCGRCLREAHAGGCHAEE